MGRFYFHQLDACISARREAVRRPAKVSSETALSSRNNWLGGAAICITTLLYGVDSGVVLYARVVEDVDHGDEASCLVFIGAPKHRDASDEDGFESLGDGNVV